MRFGVPAFACLLACGRLRFVDLPPADVTPPACTAIACMDATFATGGMYVLSVDGVPNGAFGGQGIALQPDGRIVVVGKAGTLTSSTGLVARFDPSGVLDPTFGAAGLVEIASAGAELIAVTIAPDGSIVVAGTASTGGLVAHLQPDGALDPAFGTITPSFGATVVAFNGVAVDAGGRTIVGGQADFVSFDLVADAYLADGTHDATFSALDYTGPGDDFGSLGGIAPDGNIDLFGQTLNNSSGFDGLLVHLMPDGAFDPAFGTGGIVSTDFGRNDRFLAMIRDATGGIVVTGQQDLAGVSDALVARYSASGVLDLGFATTTIDFGGNEVGRGLVELPDGRLVIGLRGDSGSRLVFLDAGGTMIGTFDLSIGDSPNGIESMILDHQHRLLVLGDAGTNEHDLYLARVIIP